MDIGFECEAEYKDPKNIILINKASEPLDILWKNMGTINTHFPFARFIVLVFGMVLVIFLSSPAVLLTRLKSIDPTGVLAFNWTYEFGFYGKYMRKSLPPMIILMINSTVIWLLDLSSVIEGYDCHSRY